MVAAYIPSRAKANQNGALSLEQCTEGDGGILQGTHSTLHSARQHLKLLQNVELQKNKHIPCLLLAPVEHVENLKSRGGVGQEVAKISISETLKRIRIKDQL